MRINNNLMAMNTHRQLGINNGAGAKSIEKLSSGYRINRAGDDAAGLAISEKMRGQIRGLNQASRNSQDAISMIQTAEGALNETHAILQRMRELAVQASTDTNTNDDRGEIQKEINQLTSEINRIGNTTEFNTMKLLNGDRAIETETTTVTSPIVNTNNLVAGAGGDVAVNASLGFTFSGSEAEWKASVTSGVSINADTTADEAIPWAAVDLNETNKITVGKDTDGNLTVQIQVSDGTDTFDHSFTFNAEMMELAAVDGVYTVDFHGVSFDLNLEAFADVTNGDSFELDLSNAIDNTETDITGTTLGLTHDFTVATEGAKFTSFNIDGSSLALAGLAELEISFDGTDVVVKGFDADGAEILTSTSTPGTAPAAAGDSFEYSENGISFKFELIADAGGTDITQFTTNKIDVSSLVAKVETVTTGGVESSSTAVVADNSLVFQVGANEGQSLSMSLGDMRAVALGIASTSSGSGYASNADVTNESASEFALNVTTKEDASVAITTIQSAIDSVSSERSKLGAIQNRLEYTIRNLDTSAENLQASESRIRDVDMAKEMMEFTKNNILQQAAQAMLAQANQAPQGVLQLLR